MPGYQPSDNGGNYMNWIPWLETKAANYVTPFILDMYRLAHKNMPDDAMALVSKYREKAQDEQICAFENLRLIEKTQKA